MSVANDKYVCIAEITSPHGVRGQVKLRLFAEDPDLLFVDGGLFDETASHFFEFVSVQPHKNGFLATVKDMSTREAAQAVRQTKLYIRRDQLPQVEENEFYHVDLIGLHVQDQNKQVLGRIKAIQNFGASDILEIQRQGQKDLLLPFHGETVVDVQLDKGYVVVHVPDGLMELYE